MYLTSICWLQCAVVVLAWLLSAFAFATQDEDNKASLLDSLGTLQWQEDRQLTPEEQNAIIGRSRTELQELSKSLPWRIAELKQSPVTLRMVEQARLDVEAVALHQESLTLDRADAERRIKRLEESVRELEARVQWLENPARGQAEAATRSLELSQARRNLAELRRALDAEKNRRDNLYKRLELAKLRRSLAQDWRAALEEAYYARQAQQQLAAREARDQVLQREQQTYLDRAEKLRERLVREADQIGEQERLQLEMSIKIAELRARLVHHDIRLAGIDVDLERLDLLVQRRSVIPRLLQGALQEIDSLIRELQVTEQLFVQGIPLGERQKKLLGRGGNETTEAHRAMESLLKDATRHQEQVAERLASATRIKARLKARYEAALRKDLLARSKLPDTSEEWWELVGHLADTPKAILYQVQLSVMAAARTLMQVPPWRWTGMVMALGLLVWVMVWVKHVSQRGIRTVSAGTVKTFVGTVSLAVLRVIQRNLLWLGLTLALLCAVWITEVPQPGSGIIATLVLVGVIIKVAFTFGGQVLDAADVRAEQIPPRLFIRLRLSVLVGAILGAVVRLIHLSGLPEATSEVMDRAFMLYLLLTFPTLLRLRGFVMDLLVERYAERLWFKTLRLVSLFLLLTFVGTGLVGVVGYLNLAWMVSWHLGMFLLVFVCWQTARGLLGDGVILLKNFAVKHSSYGLLWTQDVIAPVHRILEVVLFIGVLVVLYEVYGIRGGTALASTVSEALDVPLFSLGGVDINSYGIIVTLLLALLVIVLGQPFGVYPIRRRAHRFAVRSSQYGS
jgi:potassium efflux system protein